MVWKKLIYAFITLLDLAAFIITDHGVALFLLICLVVLPLVTYVALFFLSRHVEFSYAVGDSCFRGGTIAITMTVRVKMRLFLGSADVYADIENMTFGKTESKIFTFKDFRDHSYTYEYKSQNAGRLRVVFPKIKLFGLFGMCSLTIKCDEGTEALVSPKLYEDVDLIETGMSRAAAVFGDVVDFTKKGNDRSEIFDVRDYVPGDNLNSVHWKLSGKFDSLKSKEYGSSSHFKTLILVDPSRNKFEKQATDGEMNLVLDIAVSLSSALKDNGMPHCVGWFSDGKFCSSEVWDNESFLQMVYNQMSMRIYDGNAQTVFYFSRGQEFTKFTKIIYVSVAARADELRILRGLDVTAISLGGSKSVFDEDGIRLIELPQEIIESTLEENE
ncbi:MAG: DUF58 domain-containing protein [Clostridia bacterium]|nr:DUF58 domain-containing protein [Clostridia bacterium]